MKPTVILLTLVLTAFAARADDSTGVIDVSAESDERVTQQVVSSGGGRGTSTNYGLSGTVGQAAVGRGSSGAVSLSQGFWRLFVYGGCCLLRGDFDHDGRIDVTDIVAWSHWTFGASEIAPACEDPDGFYPECDMDGTGQVDIADIVFWAQWAFSGGADPVPCP